MKMTETELIKHWVKIRANAIEIGAIAERDLIALGYMTEDDRRVLTRAEQRAAIQRASFESSALPLARSDNR